MKNSLIFAIILAFFTLPLMAEVKAEKKADGIYLTFTFESARAKTVALIGSMPNVNWEPTKAIPMVKNGNIWSITIPVKATDKIEYKFYVDSVWTSDPKAPDNTNDNHGGRNGLAEVAKLLK